MHKQQEQESPLLPALKDTWNPRITLHTIKGTSPESDATPSTDSVLTEDSIQQFLDIGSRVVVTTATAWWTICELLDFIKLRSAEMKMKREKYTNTESATSTDEVKHDESGT